MDTATLDMAREWVNENYPHLDGAAYDAAVEEAAQDILDQEQDAQDRAAFYRKNPHGWCSVAICEFGD